MGKFSEIITLCERATMLDQSDEKMHANLIRAFVAMGDYERAAKQYDYIRAYLMEQYGAAPGAHLTELYELTVKPRNDVQNNLDAVIGDLTGDDSKEQKGVFYCQYEIFKYIFACTGVKVKESRASCLSALFLRLTAVKMNLRI